MAYRPARGHCQLNEKSHIPSDLVVDHWTADVESSSPLDFLSLHAMWVPCGCLMRYKITSKISVGCDFTTKSRGIWDILPHILECIVVVLGERAGVELHVLCLFWHLDDLGKRRLALPHVRRLYVVLGAAALRRLPLPGVCLATLRVVDLHPVDGLPGAFLKCADLPVN